MSNKTKRKKRFYFLHDLIWGVASFFGYFWFRPKRVYLSDRAKKRIKGGALLISNHIGFYDPIYIMMSLNYRRHHFLATTELFSNPIKRFLFEKVFLCIEINRQNVNGATLREIFETLESGKLISIFPEGEINRSGTDDVAKFKSGVILMAMKSNRPIVPIYIHKRKTIFNRLVTVVGEPMTVSEFDGESVMEIIEKMTAKLQEKETELRNYYLTNIAKKR